ncbi:uncharacterized protein LOC117219204 isoform X2 [Megalopta genalis]|uniref:uncharacterized protein LOC117219204 isoform X2 n=1 Tax=Megalopta genalis TaxID=115081 RepID=UPI003FD32096
MTKWNRSETNLKSSAYNQNGQSYFTQLTTYNSMSAHLRRVLLAKCVIDSRNKNFTSRRKPFCKQVECKPRFTKRIITDELIDRLAYDTLHHPADVVQMHYNSRYLCHDEDQRSSAFKSNKFETIKGNDKCIDERTTRAILKDQNGSQCKTNSRKCNEDCGAPALVPCDSTANQQNSGEEDAKYVNFVYEITREILHTHCYTDDQLREVFKRHIERNKGLLNMNKMMYEIYQLKIALNVADAWDDNDFIQPRPPTPPKVLDDNKVMGKLMSFQQGRSDETRESTVSNKSVLLVDANPELVLTERDVIMSLMEADIHPDDAQKIYRRLFTKSKDVNPACTNFVCPKTDETCDCDPASVNNWFDPNLMKVSEQEKGSTTQDLITQEDKDVQVSSISFTRQNYREN